MLAADLKVARKPVLGDGEFTWGSVVSTGARPEGTPVSAFIARLVEMCDGLRSVATILTQLAAETGRSAASLTGNVFSAVGILFADGAIAELLTPS